MAGKGKFYSKVVTPLLSEGPNKTGHFKIFGDESGPDL